MTAVIPQPDIIDPLAELDYPRLRHCTFRELSSDQPMLMIVGREHFEISEEEGTRTALLTVKRYLDGRHTIPEIAKLSGVDEASVRQIVSTLHEAGLLRRETPTEYIPGDVFAAQIDASCEMWARQIGFHHLFADLEHGDLRPEVFLGLILETYHYVKSAPKHISTAIAHCRDERLVPLLSEYFVDEWNHAGMLLGSLVQMGVPEEQVRSAHPIIGTWSLVNNLCEIARQDTLSYIACTSLFEARADDFEGGAASMRRAAVAAGFPEDSVDPVIRHMGIDVQAEHASLIGQATRILGDIPGRQAHVVVNNLHDLKHSYDQFHDQIVQYYSDISNYIPRVKVDYFSL
ncbi:hypothetical protein C6361_01800 [Plantactinospora sp. BC1]|uniref:helix-turn-helix domain-containing protein n=1 Tax=Plantactinospora sp. BC1 TaxID=2108470 RepID=UPI000D166C7D|nr:helix-turn-helix domain-containing protein [Plantactinospora sp. BC1]AVT28441.1 hypothetical protein C6361_01800 [Plantactinospora sp. BC1]